MDYFWQIAAIGEAIGIEMTLTNTGGWVRLGRGSGGLLDETELPEAERWLASPDAADLGYDAALPEMVKASQQAIEADRQEKETARRRELAQAQALEKEQRQRLAEQVQSARRLRRLTIVLAGCCWWRSVRRGWRGTRAKTR